MGPRTIAQAINALNGMGQIVEKEMLIRGDYVSNEIDKALSKAGAICGGHKYCAIGSLWAGHGVKAKWDAYNDNFLLPGATEGHERNEFLENRHGLRLAYDSINEAADNWAERNLSQEARDNVLGNFISPLESLFEATERNQELYDFKLGRPELLEIIDDAKNIVLSKAEQEAAAA